MTRQAALAVLALLLAGCGAEADSPYAAVREGNALYEAGDYKEAAERYAEAAEALPDAAAIAFNQGNSSYMRRDYEQALEHYLMALQADDGALSVQVRYNLGNVKYRQALQAMQTFQDAATPLKAAMGYYRDSLEIDSRFEDARYNLELADRLMRLLEGQQVQPQESPGSRDQWAAPPHGQAHPDRAEQERARREAGNADATPEPQGQGPRHAPEGEEASEGQAQSQSTAAPEEMTPEAAERMIDVIRERARDAEDRRNEMRQSRLRESRGEKTW